MRPIRLELSPVSPTTSRRDFFLAASVLAARIAGDTPPPVDLTKSELRVNSQNGEDGVLAEIMRRIVPSAEPSFVEFGIESGFEGNCVYLADVLGWSGVFIEPAPGLHAALASKYRMNERVRILRQFVTPQNVDELFESQSVPEQPDVVSIDIDGLDYWVWRGLRRYRPRVVIIEYNGGLGPQDALVVPENFAGWDGSDYFGASIAALERLGNAKGYNLVHTDLSGLNAFFVRRDYGSAFPGPAVRRSPNYTMRSGKHRRDEHDRLYVRDPPI